MKQTLAKRVCRMCRENTSWWNKHDDKRWRNGSVFCVMENPWRKNKISIRSKVPEGCQYELEHLVSLRRKTK